MKNIKSQLIFLSIILLGFFVWQKNVSAIETNIIITEIAAYETSNYEWIEIYNKGSAPINITDWKFFENDTNHSLNEFQNDFIIEPQEYAIIADVAENFLNNYPEFTGTIIDSSWTSLKEAGEEIGLKDSAGETIELFTYLPCPDTSLQRIDLNANNYTESNWQIHAIDNSAGQANEFEQQDDENPVDENEENNPPIITNQRIIAGSILINEFVADPVSGEPEWIEIYNKNIYEIDLTGWQILDGAETSTVLDGTILGSDSDPFFIIEAPKGKLNNSGDAIVLQDKDGNIIDSIYYGDHDNLFIENNAPAATDPFSVARIKDGANTNNNLNDFVITQTPSKGAANIITLEELGEGKKEDNHEDKEDDEEKQELEDKKEKSSSQIIINEIYPNPPGSDIDKEWLELKNISELVIDLADWKIQDNDKMIYQVSKKDFTTTLLKPGHLFTISRNISGIALNNDKDTLKLIDPENITVQTITYKEQPDLIKDAAYALNENNNWQWTSLATQNQHNLFIPVNHPPIIQIYCPKQADVNQQIICDASDSFDFENNKLQFSWQIQNQIIEKEILEYNFQEKGTYQISLTINDGKFDMIKNHTIKIIDNKITTNKPTTAAKKETKSEVDAITKIDLKNIKTIEKGTEIKTQGVVSVVPNVFGKTTMYLAGSGVQLYMYKADWPELQIGDLVEVAGSITESKGETRIKLAQQEDIKILSKQPPPQPHPITINEIGETTEGYLVQFLGQLIEKSGSRFYFQDDTGEAEVYIKKNTKIAKTEFKEGDELLVNGIVSQDNEDYQVLPRFADDLKKQHEISQGEQTNLFQNNKNQPILKYLIVSAIFLILGIGIVLYIYLKQKISSRDSRTPKVT
ncbi:lamin tail domain-containing protein [Patescibacteria group bacterium]